MVHSKFRSDAERLLGWMMLRLTKPLISSTDLGGLFCLMVDMWTALGENTIQIFQGTKTI